MKYLFFFMILLLSSLYCPAQSSLPAELHFNHLSVKDGLPEGFVNSMIQDRQGYIWMTTQQDLVRYDGYQPKVYTLGISDPNRMNVETIYQDRKGRIWAETDYAVLYLYDPGKDRFIHYPLVSKVSDSTSSFAIMEIRDDDRGRLWLSFYDLTTQKSSIILFDPGIGKFTPYGKQESGKNHIDADYLFNMYQDSKGHIWMSSSNGLYEFDEKNKRFTAHLATTDSTKQKGFYHITEDASQHGVLWFTNAIFNSFSRSILNTINKGLWRFNTAADSATVFYHNPQYHASLASDTIFKVMNDTKGRLWVGTMSGLSLFDRTKNDFINYYPDEKKIGYDNSVIDILQDKSGNFWCQTGKGILYFDTQTRKFTRITADPKKTDGLIFNNKNHSFLLNQQGTLWFGVGGDGVQWINRQRSGFVQYGNNPGSLHYFPGGMAQGFAKSGDGTIWISAQHGLYRWQPQTDSFTEIKFWKGKAVNESARFPMIDHNGKVWFYGYNNGDEGLDCYNPRTGKTQYYRYKKNDSTSLSSNAVSSIYEDHLGNIWVGTRDAGICRLDQRTHKFIRYPYILNDNFIKDNHGALDDARVLSIYEDKSGTLWVGTNLGGLNRFNRENGTFTSYINALPGFECVTSIYEDNQNRLWAGTYFGGFFRFNVKTGRPEKFTEKNGLLYDGAYAILEDGIHNLWLTSARGISIFNPQTQQVRTLTTANGLPDDNIIYATKISNRVFIFNSANGFIVADPEDFMPDPNPPVVQIESVGFTVPGSNPTRDSTIFAFGKKDIRLSYNENRLSFDYVGLYYQQADLVKYAYKLGGYDKDWITAGMQRTITYTNLSPGTYTFMVKAANSGGVWSTENPSIAITIYPPWWKTWWAYTFYIFAFVGILGGVRKFELDRRKEKENKKLLQLENERQTKELEEARQLQLSMLPKIIPSLPHLDIAVYMKTATEVGGDYYDFNVGLDGTLSVAIGDATGHGMKAGTIVSMAKALFDSNSSRLDMKTFFVQSSATLKGIELGRLMMAFMMIKIKNNTLEICNAGMPPLYIYRKSSKSVEEIQINGMPLGAVKNYPYEIKETEISAGDTLLLLSDGFPELKNKNGELYNYIRVKKSFESVAEKQPEEIITYLKEEGSRWVNDKEPDDDVTFVVIKIIG
jgi:serine phosphatase RsbU (regulator of sigma subunit)/ligand-binding sensor domain-containing protein